MATAAAPSQPAEQSEGNLRRVITTPMLVIFVLGDILGAGIYALVGEVAGEVGGAIWTAFLVALTLAFFTAFAYAELVTKYPDAAGAALYVNKALRKPFVTFLVAFTVAASGITSASTAAIAFGGDYLGVFIELPVLGVAIAFILVLALINYRGINESIKVNLGLTAIEIAGLLIIVGIGIAALVTGAGEPSRALEFNPDTSAALAVIGGASLAFFALIGFEDSVNVAEETTNPRRAYPRALFGGLALASVIYLFVAFTATMVVPTQQLADSDGPLLEVVRAGPLAIPPRVFSVFALVAVTNTALINMIMASRLLYGMAKQNIVPSLLGRVGGRKTPVVAIVLTTLVAFALVATGELDTLADTTVLLLLIVFTLVNICALLLRNDQVDHDYFRAPVVFPVLGALSSLLLLTQQEAAIWLRAGILMAVGLVLWGVNRAVSGPLESIEAEKLQD